MVKGYLQTKEQSPGRLIPRARAGRRRSDDPSDRPFRRSAPSPGEGLPLIEPVDRGEHDGVELGVAFDDLSEAERPEPVDRVPARGVTFGDPAAETACAFVRAREAGRADIDPGDMNLRLMERTMKTTTTTSTKQHEEPKQIATLGKTKAGGDAFRMSYRGRSIVVVIPARDENEGQV